MKNLFLVLFLLGSLPTFTQAQKAQLAKSYDEYAKLYHNPEVRMVRSHRDFIAYAKQNRVLKTHVKGSTLKAFLRELKFSKNGLITCSFGMFKANPKMEQAIFNEIAQGFGWEPIILAADHKGYKCRSSSTCITAADYICLGKSCGESVMKGPDYDPEYLMN